MCVYVCLFHNLGDNASTDSAATLSHSEAHALMDHLCVYVSVRVFVYICV
jgi:hypothetical protein